MFFSQNINDFDMWIESSNQKISHSHLHSQTWCRLCFFRNFIQRMKLLRRQNRHPVWLCRCEREIFLLLHSIHISKSLIFCEKSFFRTDFFVSKKFENSKIEPGVHLGLKVNKSKNRYILTKKNSLEKTFFIPPPRFYPLVKVLFFPCESTFSK